MKRWLNKKKFILVSAPFLLTATLIFVLPVSFSQAASTSTAVTATGKSWWGTLFNIFSIGDITSGAITFAAGIIAYIAGFIASAIFTVGGWLVEFALKINLEILKSPIIQDGWQEILAFANLGFVLAIIVIAFTTIFRVQGYQMKQILWKLIVAALLVNFSLVIAGAFINISDILSNYFLEKATLQGQGFTKFSNLLAKALGAQAFLKMKNADDLQGVIANGFGTGILTVITSLFFIVAFTLVGALTLLAVAIMLFIRYVYLGILLILSPIVWLLWIFPATQKHWKDWWDKFFRWTFFAPIMLFFLSLATSVLEKTGERINIMNTANEITGALGAEAPLTFGFDAIGNLVIVIGLMMGGLFAANSLSITFASTAYGLAQGGGKAFGGWAGRKGTQFGTSPLRRKWGEPGKEKSLAERTQEWAASRKTTLGRFAAGWVSQGTSKLSAIGGENLIKQEEGRIKDMTLLQKKAALLTAGGPLRVALLKNLAESKDLDGVDMTRFLVKKQKDEFHRFGQGVAFGNIEKTVGKSVEMLEAASTKDADALRKATDKFVKGLKQADLAKGQWNDIFGKEPAFKLDKETHSMLANDLAAAFAEYMPGAFAKIGPQIKGKNMDSYKETVNYQISLLEKEKPDVAKKARESFEKNMGWLSLGLGAEELRKE